MNEIVTALGSLKAAFELTKTMLDANSSAQARGKVIELQSKILAAQEGQLGLQEQNATLSQRIRDLEQQIAGLQKFDADKVRYQLTEVGTGAFAYVPKPGGDEAEPSVWLCAKCFDTRVKSILQQQGRVASDQSTTIYACPTCKSQIRVHYSRAPGRAVAS